VVSCTASSGAALLLGDGGAPPTVGVPLGVLVGDAQLELVSEGPTSVGVEECDAPGVTAAVPVRVPLGERVPVGEMLGVPEGEAVTLAVEEALAPNVTGGVCVPVADAVRPAPRS
jgi:hypothetical protein